MIVFCIEGSGAISSRGAPLFETVRALLISNQIGCDICGYKPDDMNENCKHMVQIAVEHGVGNYLFVGKSLGAFELYENRDALSPIIDCSNNRVAIVTVDPHAAFWQCGPGSPIDATWTIEPRHIKAWNVFQQCRYPRGAVVVGAKNTEVHNTTHSKIVRSDQAIEAYLEAASWLIGGQ